EVGHQPALVDRVAGEAAAEVIVDAAARHLLRLKEKGALGRLAELEAADPAQQLVRRGRGELGLGAEAAVVRVAALGQGAAGGDQHSLVEISGIATGGAAAVVLVELAQAVEDGANVVIDLIALLAVDAGHGAKDLGKAGAAVAFGRRKVGAEEK